MADNRIRRLVTLVFDKAAANKAEAEAQRSLERATNTKSIGQKISGLLNTTIRLATQAAASLAVYLRALDALTERGGKVIQVSRAFTNAVGNQEAAIQDLRKQTKGLISDYDLMVSMNKAITLGAVTNTKDFGDLANTAVILGRAIGVDAAYALETMTLGIGRQSTRVLDNIGLIVKVRQANQQYASALHKNVDALTLTEQKEAFRLAAIDAAKKKISELGQGLDTNADRLQRVKIGFTNLKDEIGKFLAQSTTLGTFFFESANVMDTLVLSLQSQDAETVKSAFGAFGSLLGSLFADAFFTAASKIFGLFSAENIGTAGQVLGGATVGAMTGLIVGGPMGALVGGVAGGVGAPFAQRFLTKETKEAADAAQDNAQAQVVALDALRKQLEVAAKLKHLHDPPPKGSPEDPATQAELEKIEDDRLKLLLKAQELRVIMAREEMELFDIYLKSNKALRDGNLTIAERIRLRERENASLEGIMNALGDPFAPDRFGNRRFITPQIRLPSTLRMGGANRDRGAGRLASFFLAGAGRDEEGKFQGGENFQNIVSAAQAAAQGMQDAFTDAFLTIGQKGKILEDLEAERVRRMAEANTEAERKKVEEWYAIEKKNADELNGLWETLARGFASSILSGIAQVATTKVAENVAKALEALGDGLLGNPAGFAAAASYGKAAAAWALVGGIANAAASKASGQGGGASSFRGSSAVGSRTDNLNRQGGDIVIYLDGVDPNNPRHQRLVGETARQYQQRYGGNVRVQSGGVVK